jgi:hypothetical protein
MPQIAAPGIYFPRQIYYCFSRRKMREAGHILIIIIGFIAPHKQITGTRLKPVRVSPL